MKGFWGFLTRILVVVILLGFFWIMFQDSRVSTEVRMIEEQNAIRELSLAHEQKIESMQWWHDLNRKVVWSIQAVVLGVAIGLSAAASIGGLSFAGMMVAKWQRSITDHRAQDGLWGIKVIQTGPWWKRLVGRGETTILNLNNIVPGVSVLTTADGLPKLAVAANGFSDEQQLDAHKRQQQIQMVQAAKGKTPAQKAPNKWEVLERNNLLPEPKRQAIPEPEAQVIDAPALPQWTVIEALKESTVDRFVLGQADDGSTFDLNLRSDVHCGILGSTGTGKTASTGFHLAATALGKGYRLIILDGKGGADWGCFEDVAEWHPTNSMTLMRQMMPIYAEYERRLAITGKERVSHISQLRLPEMPPILVIIEEFGMLRRTMNAKELSQVSTWLSIIGAVGRVTDVHVCIVDQHPKGWDTGLVNSTKSLIVYKMGKNLGRLAGAWDAQNLPSRGRFIHDGQEYNSWYVQPVLPRLLSDIQKGQDKGYIQRYPMLIDASYERVDTPVDRVDTSGQSQHKRWTPLQERNGGVHTVHSGQRGEGVGPKKGADTPPSGGQWTVDSGPTEAQQAIIEFLRKNPGMSDRSAAEAIDRDDVSKSYVNKVRHQFADLIDSKGKVH